MMMVMTHAGDPAVAQMAAAGAGGVMEATPLAGGQIQVLVAGPNGWASYVETYQRLMASRGTPVTVVTSGATARDEVRGG